MQYLDDLWARCYSSSFIAFDPDERPGFPAKAARGEVYGPWRRPVAHEAKQARGKAKSLTANATGRLKLLVAFRRPAQTRKRLEFGMGAQAIVSANFNRVFGAELAKAIATSASAQ
ncbi:hypothetical protein KNO81_39680 [Paraburkholderia sediminicola]|nr:hypothetical protein [Paraburkholderia sediminicola]